VNFHHVVGLRQNGKDLNAGSDPHWILERKSPYGNAANLLWTLTMPSARSEMN
jgi:hypothetical protein